MKLSTCRSKYFLMAAVICTVITTGSLHAAERAGVSATIHPSTFPVYENTSFTVTLIANVPLEPGTLLEVQLPNSFSNDKVSPSKVKPWQTVDPDKRHYISVDCPDSPDVGFDLDIRRREYVGGYNVAARHGVCLNIVVRDKQVRAGQKIHVQYQNTTTPWLANQLPGATDHEGMVYVAVNGIPIRNFPMFTVESGPEKYRRVIIPSSVRPGESFDVHLVSLDKYNNLSTTYHENVSLTCNQEILASGINYRGKGMVQVVLPEKGVFRIDVDGVLSNPIRVMDNPRGPFWGDIHFHNYPSIDAMGNTPYLYAREVSCLDFAGAAEHGAGGLPAHWAQTKKWVQQNNRPGAFVTILALESSLTFVAKEWHRQPHMNIYHYVDDAEVLYGTERYGETATKKDRLFQYLDDYKVIAQTHHSGWGYDMRMRYPSEMKLIEIYSMHGQSEYYDNDTPLSMSNQRHRPGGRQGPYYARDAWALGKRWCCMGSSDNHFGQPGVHYNSITAAYSDQLTRNSILDAMGNGNCYATTGERVLLNVQVNGHGMGSTIKRPEDGKLQFQIEVHGTGKIVSVELFGCPFIEGDRTVEIGQLMFEEEDPRVDVALNAWETVYAKRAIGKLDYAERVKVVQEEDKMVYYVRVTQLPIELPCDLEGSGIIQKRPVVAWSTPVWVEK
ncbi:MAG: hypothetical protein OES84_02830 [Kiritimatiellaceae bacterium]|nr:hypothetical protein [Kiritimatiellaceae bacterium]